MSSFAYSVAIKLSVANLASQGVKLLAADLLKAHGQAVNLQDKLKALRMVAIGYGMEKVGQGMLGFLHKAVDGSKEYTHQLALMNAAGFTHKELAESVGSAWKTSHDVISSTAAGNIETIRELRSAFGAGEGMEHAYTMLPIVQRMNGIMTSLTGKEQHNVGFDAVKAIEFGTKGALTVPEMQRQSEMMTKALMAFGGTLTVSDFHQTFKAAKTAAAFMTDDFKYTILPTIMQEMKSGHGGAQAAGTAIATLFGTIKGHAIMTRMIPAWMDAGLIAKGGVQADKHHKGVSRIGPGGIAGEDLFTRNPEEWAVKYLIPARDKLMKLRHIDEVGAYYSLTGNRNTAFMFQTLANKGLQFARDQDLIRRAPGSVGAYNQLLNKDPVLAEEAIHAQWKNLLAIIGYQILPKMIPFMVKFAEGLNAISTWMAAHPNITQGLVIGLGAVGIALTILGKVMMTAGIIKFLGIGPMVLRVLPAFGLVGIVIAAIGTAAYLVYRNWSSIGPKLKAMWSGIKSAASTAATWIADKASKVWAPFQSRLDKLGHVAKAIGAIIGDNWQVVATSIRERWSKAKEAVAPYLKAAQGIWSDVTPYFSKVWKWIGDLVKSSVDKISDVISKTFVPAMEAVNPPLAAIIRTLHGADILLNSADQWAQNQNKSRESPYVRPGGHQVIQVNHSSQLNGKEIHRSQTRYMARDAARPNTGTSGFNPGYSIMQPVSR